MALNRITSAEDNVQIKNIIVSVSDKTGLEDFIPGLVGINSDIKIFSTGGTFTKIGEILGNDASMHLISVSDYTGQPEMQGGLVKTLDFKIYLGLLSETCNESHKADLERSGAAVFDMVVVNLYPFVRTIREANVTAEDARTNIDIGGPCMLRAAAKNFLRVASICDPGDYDQILNEMKSSGGNISFATRFSLASKSFLHTAEYDTAIAEYMARQKGESVSQLYAFTE